MLIDSFIHCTGIYFWLNVIFCSCQYMAIATLNACTMYIKGGIVFLGRKVSHRFCFMCHSVGTCRKQWKHDLTDAYFRLWGKSEPVLKAKESNVHMSCRNSINFVAHLSLHQQLHYKSNHQWPTCNYSPALEIMLSMAPVQVLLICRGRYVLHMKLQTKIHLWQCRYWCMYVVDVYSADSGNPNSKNI